VKKKNPLRKTDLRLKGVPTPEPAPMRQINPPNNEPTKESNPRSTRLSPEEEDFLWNSDRP
jgi:hypothetical protein